MEDDARCFGQVVVILAISVSSIACWPSPQTVTPPNPPAEQPPPMDGGGVEVVNTYADSDIQLDVFPDIASDGAGRWIAVWESEQPAVPGIGSDADILLSRRGGAGSSWSAPELLNLTGLTDRGRDSSPTLATDRRGNWVAAWHSAEELDGRLGTDFDIMAAWSNDNGDTWSQPVIVNGNAEDDFDFDRGVSVVTDGEGNWLAVWELNERTIDGRDRGTFRVAAACSSDNGKSWSDPALLNTPGAVGKEQGVTIAAVSTGSASFLVVWGAREPVNGELPSDGDVHFSRSTDGGQTWTLPAILNSNSADDAAFDTGVSLAANNDGTIIAVWESDESFGDTIGGDWDLLRAVSHDGGVTWGEVRALNTNAATDRGGDINPCIRHDGSDVWAVVWESQEAVAGIGDDWDILIAWSFDGGETWTEPVPTHANAGIDSGLDLNPRIAHGGQGRWMVIWESADTLGDTVGTDRDIFATEIGTPIRGTR